MSSVRDRKRLVRNVYTVCIQVKNGHTTCIHIIKRQ